VATIKKAKERKDKDKLLKKAASSSNPVVSAAGSQAKKLKDKAPGV
jgi:hypothetical protein